MFAFVKYHADLTSKTLSIKIHTFIFHDYTKLANCDVIKKKRKTNKNGII